MAIESLGSGLVMPFAVLYLHEVRGFPLELAGSLLGLPALVALLVVGPGGSLIDHLGARGVVVAGMIAQFLGNVTLAFATTPIVAVAGFILIGLAFGVFWPAFNTLIATVVPSPIRQRYYGLNFAMVNLGVGIGGALGGLFVDVTRPATFTTIYLVNAASFLAPLAVVLGPLRHVTGRVPAPPELAPTSRRPAYLTMLRDPALAPLAILSFVATFVGYAQLEAGLTAFARFTAEVSTRVIGFAFAANTVVIVLLQIVVLQAIEGRRRTRVLLLMSGVWAVAWILLGLSGLVPGTLGAAILVAGCAAVFGFGETLLQPTLPAITNDLAPDHLRGRYNAVLSASFQSAALAGPVIAGLLLARGQARVYLVVLLAGCALLAVLVLRVLERRIPPHANGVG